MQNSLLTWTYMSNFGIILWIVEISVTRRMQGILMLGVDKLQGKRNIVRSKLCITRGETAGRSIWTL